MGLGDFLNGVGDAIEDGVENVVEGAGEIIDDGLDVLSDGAEAIGLDGVSEALDDFGDEVASATGGDVEERELGESEDPKELILGDPADIGSRVDTLGRMSAALESTGDALAKIDAGEWVGDGAEAFDRAYDKQPRLWFDGADAMEGAAKAMDAWHNEVDTAQKKAADAIAKWKAARDEEVRQKTWWNSLTGEQQAQTTLVDTWSGLQQEARDILRGARTQRDNGASIAVSAIAAATAKAPEEPPFSERMLDNITDLKGVFDHGLLNFTSGLLTSLTGIVQFVRQVNPLDIYNITHPAEYASGLSDLGTGLVVAAADPGAAVSTFLSEARDNPFNFAGALTGDALLGLATGGGGTAVSAAKKLKDLAKVGSKAAHGLERVGGAPRVPEIHPSHPDAPTPHAPEPGAGSAHTDPGHAHDPDPIDAGSHPDGPAQRHDEGDPGSLPHEQSGSHGTPEHHTKTDHDDAGGPYHENNQGPVRHVDPDPAPTPHADPERPPVSHADPDHSPASHADPDRPSPSHADPDPARGNPERPPVSHSNPEPSAHSSPERPVSHPDAPQNPHASPEHPVSHADSPRNPATHPNTHTDGAQDAPQARPEHTAPHQDSHSNAEHNANRSDHPGSEQGSRTDHENPSDPAGSEHGQRTDRDAPAPHHPEPEHTPTDRYPDEGKPDPDQTPPVRPDDGNPTGHTNHEGPSQHGPDSTTTRTDPGAAPGVYSNAGPHAGSPTSPTANAEVKTPGPRQDAGPAPTTRAHPDLASAARAHPDSRAIPRMTPQTPARSAPGANSHHAPDARQHPEAPSSNRHDSDHNSSQTPHTPENGQGHHDPGSRTPHHDSENSSPHDRSTRPDDYEPRDNGRQHDSHRDADNSTDRGGRDHTREPDHDSNGRDSRDGEQRQDHRPHDSDRHTDRPDGREHRPHDPHRDPDNPADRDGGRDRTREQDHDSNGRGDRDAHDRGNRPDYRPHDPHRDVDNPTEHGRHDRESGRDSNGGRLPHDSDTPGDRDQDHRPHDSDQHPRDHDPDQDQPTAHDRADADAGAHEHARESGAESDRTPEQKTCSTDPVDISTGEFLLPETDIELPGVLALALHRSHHSNYRFGRWFGPSWSATVDVRVIVEVDGVTFVGEDGIMLAYPHAEAGVPVAPLTRGQHWSLTRTEAGGYRVLDQRRELIWHFAPELGLDGIEARLGNFALSAITDRHHNRVRFHYDHDGVPVEVSHSGGYRVRVDSQAGRITGLALVTDEPELGEFATALREFGYAEGELVSVADGGAAVTRYTYDDEHRMTSWLDSNGNRMVNTYDEFGRVVHQRGTAGILNCDYDYRELPEGAGRLTTVTDSLGASTTHGFDRELQLRDLRDPTGRPTHIDYNADRKPLTIVASDGARTSYTYNSVGDATKVAHPDGSSTEIEYLWRNRPSTITAPDGAVSRLEWSEEGDLAATVDPAGTRTEYTYHFNGALATVEANGTRTAVRVNGAGLPVEVTAPDGAVTRIRRDAMGRAVEVTDPLGAVTRYEWTPTGHLLRRRDPDGRTDSWTYDGEGNVRTHLDRAGGRTEFTYGAFDLLHERTSTDGAVTRFSWDTERRVTTVHNPIGQNWVYEYDAAGSASAETDYTGATTRYTHDRGGRIATVASAAGTVRHHHYDILGRLTEISTDADEWIRYTYDRGGRTRTAVNGVGADVTHALEFAYTATGSLASVQRDGALALEFDYDRRGHRSRRTAASGNVTTWHHDILGRPDRIGADGHDVSFEHDRLGRLIGWRVGEVAVTRELTEAGRVAHQEVTAFPAAALSLDLGPATRPEPRRLRRDEFAYRHDGYLTAQTVDRSATAPARRDFDLDPAGRVTTIAENGTPVEHYTYDQLANVTSGRAERAAAQADSGDGHREYRDNLLIRDGRTRYHYDRCGRLIRKTTTRLSRKPEVWHYRYNGFDQLTDVWTPDRQWWRYTYDALGRRTTKQRLGTDGAVLEHVDYLWDGSHLIEQTSAESTTRWQYQPGSHTPLTQTTARDAVDREFFAIITDLVGTPTELIDATTGDTTGVAESDLWGRTVWRGTASTPLRFPGQIDDPESGLHYNHHRYYDPETARYLTQDPLGLDPAPNPNTYVHNPTTWLDPLGLMCKEFNTNGKHLSDKNPVPPKIREQYEEIHAGNGTPRIDPATHQQTVHEGRQLSPRQRSQWAGSLEWDVPGTRHRILERPDGLFGYVLDHDYRAPFLFPGPWYPEGGKIPQRLGK
ncbi:putative T7SS-secreted protein [Nocardia callitridis]|uniref:Type IV secretion protein Rhs n=1 Tax=Nocardia callitridis TaxID=648753 RepID=A0ABP9KY43_9NOCA